MISEYSQLEIAVSEKKFKYNLGDCVYLRSDEKKKNPLLVSAFLCNDDTFNDYLCVWLNSQGKREIGSFPEECLSKNPS